VPGGTSFAPTSVMDAKTIAFYRSVLTALKSADIPFLVGGGFALGWYTSIHRYTKDLDVFIQPKSRGPVLQALAGAGFRTELRFRHWLAKVHCDSKYVDVIFSSGNGLADVTDEWFGHAVPAELMEIPVQLCAPEEMIFSKAFIMERNRYDGADIAHLMRARGRELDWPRLIGHFGPYWRVLLSHLILFEFIYPGEPSPIPPDLLENLVRSWRSERTLPRSASRICQGSLLSTIQYNVDIEDWGYEDARLIPRGKLTRQEIKEWTEAILRENQAKHHQA